MKVKVTKRQEEMASLQRKPSISSYSAYLAGGRRNNTQIAQYLSRYQIQKNIPEIQQHK